MPRSLSGQRLSLLLFWLCFWGQQLGRVGSGFSWALDLLGYSQGQGARLLSGQAQLP